MHFAELNNVTIHYQLLSAPADKPTMVFINSLGTDFRIWRDVIINFAGDLAMVTYDKRGHGLSSVGHAPYSMEDHVDDLIALLEHLNLSKAILCGVSVGGMIAQGVYAKRPDLVQMLILCDTGHKIGNEELWNERIEALEMGGIEEIADLIIERWFTEEFQESQPAALQGYYNMLSRQPLAGYIGTCIALRDADYTEEAQEIDVPTLCVVGDQDKATPPDLVEELAGLVPNSDFEIIRNAGHLPSIEQADELSSIMKKFIAKNLLASTPVHANTNKSLH